MIKRKIDRKSNKQEMSKKRRKMQDVKVLVIGDLHFKINNLVTMKILTENILEIAKKNKLDFIVCLGDTLDRHETINMFPLVDSIEFLNKLSDISKTFLIIGNHDRPNNSDYLSKHHPFVGLENNKNIVVVDTVKHHSVEKDNKTFNFVFVPYVPPGRFYEALSQFEMTPSDFSNNVVYFAHQEFRGCELNNITRSNNGDKWDINWPLIISGHIHKYQIIDNIIYPGTPVQHSFGEDNDKSIATFKFMDKDEVIDYSMDRIRLDGVPEKITEICDTSNIKNLDIDFKNETRIIVEGTSAEIKITSRSKQVENLRKKGIKIAYKIKDPPSDIKPEIIKKSFLELVREKITHDKYLISIFSELFN